MANAVTGIWAMDSVIPVAQGGSVINVIKTETHVGFGVANVNFYMPGITGAENIHVYTYNESTNTRIEVTVTEKRADHVVVNLMGTGVLAFIVTP